MFDLKGKVVVVTGGNGFLGQVLCRLLQVLVVLVHVLVVILAVGGSHRPGSDKERKRERFPVSVEDHVQVAATVDAHRGPVVVVLRVLSAEPDEHDNVYLPRQFDNDANIEAHECSTGPEIETQLATYGRKAE